MRFFNHIQSPNYSVRFFILLFLLIAHFETISAVPSMKVDYVKDQEGIPLDGKNLYVIHFDKDHLKQYTTWNLTINGNGKQTIRNSDPLQYNADGSLDIYIQNTTPDTKSNWLKAPTGPFTLSFKGEQLNKNSNTPPSIRKVEFPAVDPILLPEVIV
jgi:hypothetical protein